MSFVQTAEGALNEVHSILQRMRELAVDAANTATTDGVAQQAEVTELLAELTAIGSNSTFAGKTVFSNYAAATLTFHVGSGAGQTLDDHQRPSDHHHRRRQRHLQRRSSIWLRSAVGCTGDADSAITASSMTRSPLCLDCSVDFGCYSESSGAHCGESECCC